MPAYPAPGPGWGSDYM